MFDLSEWPVNSGGVPRVSTELDNASITNGALNVTETKAVIAKPVLLLPTSSVDSAALSSLLINKTYVCWISMLPGDLIWFLYFRDETPIKRLTFTVSFTSHPITARLVLGNGTIDISNEANNDLQTVDIKGPFLPRGQNFDKTSYVFAASGNPFSWRMVIET